MRDTLIPLISTRCKSDMLRDHAALRGHVAYLMAQHFEYREYPLAALSDWLELPIALGQIQVFFDPVSHTPVGYATWAFLSPEVERRWLDDPSTLLHYSEWNEGDRLWIMDLVAPFGHVGDIVRYLRRQAFPVHNLAKSLRRDLDGNVVKVTTWRRAKACNAEQMLD